MPARDRTGPKGEGPRTGRGVGDCGATLAGEDGIEVKDRGAGWGAGAGLAQLRATSSASAPTAGIKLLTLLGSLVHNRYAPAVTRA